MTDDTIPLSPITFLVGSFDAVREKHRRIVEAGFDAPSRPS